MAAFIAFLAGVYEFLKSLPTWVWHVVGYAALGLGCFTVGCSCARGAEPPARPGGIVAGRLVDLRPAGRGVRMTVEREAGEKQTCESSDGCEFLWSDLPVAGSVAVNRFYGRQAEITAAAVVLGGKAVRMAFWDVADAKARAATVPAACDCMRGGFCSCGKDCRCGDTATVVVHGVAALEFTVEGANYYPNGQDARTLRTPPLPGPGHYAVKAGAYGRSVSGEVTVKPGCTTDVWVYVGYPEIRFTVRETVPPPLAAAPAYFPQRPVFTTPSFFGGRYFGGGCANGRCSGGR